MEMDYQIFKRPDYLHVQGLKGKPSSTQQDFFSLIPMTARAAGLHKILVDARAAQGEFNAIKRFEYGMKMAQHFQQLKVAVLIKEAHRDPNRLGENVAINRGANLGVFTSLEEAQQWLGVKSVEATEAPR